MSIEIKITLPSADSLNNNGWARNSIFRIIEGGGQVESSAIMSIYRSLDKRKRLDFIKKSLHCCEFTKAELNEILTNHKRSPWVQTVAVVCQPAFSKEFRLQKLEETVKKTTTALEKTKKDILDTSRSPYDSWRFGKLIDNRYLQMITHCLRRGQVSQISIDEIDEDLLYVLNTNLAGAFEVSSLGYVTWRMQKFMEVIASGTRTSLFVPFVSSSNARLEKTGTHYLTLMYQKGGK